MTQFRSTKIILWAAICLSLLLVGQQAHADDLRLAAGNKDLGYHSIAHAFKIVYQLRGHNLDVISTEGSFQNIGLLLNGDVDVAICQADLIQDAFRTHPGELVILGGLHLEPLQVVFPQDVGLKSLKSLSRRRVGIGEKGSGTYTNSRVILSDLSISLIDTAVISPQATAQALIENRLDAALMITAAPSPLLEDLLGRGSFRLLSIPRPESSLLVERHDYLKLVTIPAKTYPGQTSPVTTIGVRAYLVARNDLPAAIVQDLLGAIYLDLPRNSPAKSLCPDILSQIHLNSGPGRNSFEMHPTATTFFNDNLDQTIFEMLLAHWQFMFFAVIPVLLLMLRRWIAHRHHELSRLLGALISLMLAWILGSVLLYAFEHTLNDNFSDLMSSLWSTTTYLFSGFEEKYPFTTGGRIVSVLMIIFGLGVIAFVTGDISSILTKKRLEEGKVKYDQMENHILVVNWNSRTDLILKQICECATDAGRPVCVLSTEKVEMDDHIKKDRFRGREIAWIVGDPLDKTYLKMVGAHLAWSVLIMANEGEGDPDAFTALIGLAIHSLKAEEFRKQNHGSDAEIPDQPHVSAESMNHRKKDLMKDAHIDEVVCSTDYGIGILAQTVSSNDISRVYDRLLTFSDSTNEVYFVSSKDIGNDGLWQKSVVNKTFKELSEIFIQFRDPGNAPLLLIGVKRDYRFFLNPHPLRPEEGQKEQNKIGDPHRDLMDDKFYQFHKDDMLVFLSFTRPDIHSYLEKATG